MSRVVKKIVMQEAWEAKKKSPKSLFSRCLRMAWSNYFSALELQKYQAKVLKLDVSGLSPMDAAIKRMQLLGEYKKTVQERMKTNSEYTWG